MQEEIIELYKDNDSHLKLKERIKSLESLLLRASVMMGTDDIDFKECDDVHTLIEEILANPADN